MKTDLLDLACAIVVEHPDGLVDGAVPAAVVEVVEGFVVHSLVVRQDADRHHGSPAQKGDVNEVLARVVARRGAHRRTHMLHKSQLAQ